MSVPTPNSDSWLNRFKSRLQRWFPSSAKPEPWTSLMSGVTAFIVYIVTLGICSWFVVNHDWSAAIGAELTELVCILALLHLAVHAATSPLSCSFRNTLALHIMGSTWCLAYLLLVVTEAPVLLVGYAFAAGALAYLGKHWFGTKQNLFDTIRIVSTAVFLVIGAGRYVFTYSTWLYEPTSSICGFLWFKDLLVSGFIFALLTLAFTEMLVRLISNQRIHGTDWLRKIIDKAKNEWKMRGGGLVAPSGTRHIDSTMAAIELCWDVVATLGWLLIWVCLWIGMMILGAILILCSMLRPEMVLNTIRSLTPVIFAISVIWVASEWAPLMMSYSTAHQTWQSEVLILAGFLIVGLVAAVTAFVLYPAFFPQSQSQVAADYKVQRRTNSQITAFLLMTFLPAIVFSCHLPHYRSSDWIVLTPTLVVVGSGFLIRLFSPPKHTPVYDGTLEGVVHFKGWLCFVGLSSFFFASIYMWRASVWVLTTMLVAFLIAAFSLRRVPSSVKTGVSVTGGVLLIIGSLCAWLGKMTSEDSVFNRANLAPRVTSMQTTGIPVLSTTAHAVLERIRGALPSGWSPTPLIPPQLPSTPSTPPNPFAGDFTNSIGMKFVRIVPGSEGKLATFKMGSPREEAGRSPWNEEQVDVTITEEFWLGVYEVTEEEFDALKEVKSFDQAEKTGLFAAIFGSRFAKKAAQSEQHDLPASSMTWYQAMEFTRELTKREQASGQLPRNLRYTLPTEAQWEYACRAGTTTAFSVGSGLSLDHTQANFDSHLGVCKVGNYLPNRWGLYDMHGNVWEWCLDQFKTELPGGADPVVNDLVGADETERVIRGGIYFNDASWLRSAARWRRKPNEKAGVRLAVVRVKYDNE